MKDSDIKTLNKCIELLYLGVRDRRYWEAFIVQAQTLFVSSQASIIINDHSDPALNTGITTFDDNLIQEYFDYYIQTDLWVQVAIKGGIVSKDVIDCEHLVSDRDILKTEFYADFMRKADMRYGLASGISGSENNFVYFTLNRSLTAGKFTSKEKMLLALLAPHIKQAIELTSIFNKAQLTTLLDFCTTNQGSVIIGLTGSQEVCYLSDAAKELINNGSLNFGKHLLFNSHNLSTLIKDFMLLPFFRDQQERTVPLMERSSGLHYLLKLKKLHSMGQDIFAGALTHKKVEILAVITPLKSPILGVQQFSEIFSITKREFDVVLCLAKGYTVSETSVVLNISKETTRKHLKSTFLKSKVNSQAELLHLVNSLNV